MGFRRYLSAEASTERRPLNPLSRKFARILVRGGYVNGVNGQRQLAQELGPDWKAIQERWLHTIGNLTLTGYNPELSDRPFTENNVLTASVRQLSHLAG